MVALYTSIQTSRCAANDMITDNSIAESRNRIRFPHHRAVNGTAPPDKTLCKVGERSRCPINCTAISPRTRGPGPRPRSELSGALSDSRVQTSQRVERRPLIPYDGTDIGRQSSQSIAPGSDFPVQFVNLIKSLLLWGRMMRRRRRCGPLPRIDLASR
jgi:hypothetical protein